MKIISWNVNSLKIRHDQLVDIINKHNPDVISLQETKSQDENFPIESFNNLGYQSIFTGQKTFNGVAIITKLPYEYVLLNIPNFQDEQKRFVSAEVKFDDRKILIMNGYFPNGQSLDSDKFIYKQSWVNALLKFIKTKNSNSLLMGDFNIAPDDIDCHDPEKWVGTVLTSNIERNLFKKIIECNFTDTHRHLNKNEPGFTWWDYRMAAFRRNLGLRIDHILASHDLINFLRDFSILADYRKLERPSDHAPIMLTLSF
jgi:exodeoxyribonuclease-3